MNMRFNPFALVLSAFLVFAGSAFAAEAPSLTAVTETGIDNLHNPEANRFSSGQPTQEQLATLSELGIRHVVNLRMPSEQDWDEQALVESLGMSYHALPVSVPEGVSTENAETLASLLESFGDEPVLLHCASGNRVGALIAIRKGKETGDVEAAVMTGKEWGLTRLEPAVRKELE